VSLFTKVLINETEDLLGRHFEEVLGVFCHFLLHFQWTVLGQTDGLPMGSPPSLVTANYYMEDYENAVLESDPLKPRCWFSYIDDTLIIWQQGPDKFKDFYTR
jgi:hypothetical protein